MCNGVPCRYRIYNYFLNSLSPVSGLCVAAAMTALSYLKPASMMNLLSNSPCSSTYLISQNSLQLLSQRLLDSQSIGKSCMALTQCGHCFHMALTQCGHCFQSFVLLRAEVSGTPHRTTTQDRGFLGLTPIQAPLPSNFSSFKTQSFAYSFCSSLAYHSKFFHVAYIAVLHGTTHVQYFFFYQTFGDISSTMHTLLKYSK